MSDPYDFDDLPFESNLHGRRTLSDTEAQAVFEIADANRRWTSADIAAEVSRRGMTVTAGEIEQALGSRGAR